MWRRHLEGEDWERRRLYLIRSLFADPPLSPVQEEDESVDSTRSRIRATQSAPSPLPSLRPGLDRPCSPPPPLIIEPEPNRHDEPEEFYKKLEKKVLKVYRKLFIEGRSHLSDITSESEVTEDTLVIPTARTSFGEIEDNSSQNAENTKNISFEINESTGRERTISEHEAKNNKSKSTDDNDFDNRSSTEVLPETTTDENEEQLSESLISDPETSRYRGEETEDKDDESSDTLRLYPADNGGSKGADIQNETVERLSGTSSHPADSNGHKGAETDIEEDDQIIDTLDPDSANKHMATESDTGSAILKLCDHRIVTFRADVHKDASDDISFEINENTGRERTISEHEAKNKSRSTDDNDFDNRSSTEVLPETTTDEEQNRTITLRADVHKDASDDGSMVTPPPNVAVAMDKMTENSADLAILENKEVSDHSHTSSRTVVIREMEVMRATQMSQIRPSAGSHNDDRSVSRETDTNVAAMDLEANILEAVTESSASDTNAEHKPRNRKRSRLHVAEPSFWEARTGSSSSNSVADFNNDDENDSQRRKGRSSSQTIYEDAETQTSLDYDAYERMNRDILRDIFVGTPKVFRLCSCFNHHCDC